MPIKNPPKPKPDVKLPAPPKPRPKKIEGTTYTDSRPKPGRKVKF